MMLYGNPLIQAEWTKFDNAEDRFWSRVDKKDNVQCWEWKGSVLNHGYGQTRLGKKMASAHVASWFYIHGTFPKKSLLHSCDNKICVNPAHLREGSHQENMDDMTSRNRQAKGADCGSSKLTANQVLEIRELLENKTPYKEIIERFGVQKSMIGYIKQRKFWKHI